MPLSSPVPVLFGVEIAGTTANRPTNAPPGFCYFDVTAGKPMYWDDINSQWVDAGGTPAFNNNLLYAGTTGNNKLTVPTNLADALTVLDTAGTAVQFLTFTTTTATPGIVVKQNLTIADGKNIVLNTTTGTKIGTSATQKLGFYNAAPVVQPSVIAAAKADYTTGDLDSEAEIITALNAANGKLNSVLTALKALGLVASA